MRNIKMMIEYDGGRNLGWQKLGDSGKTIQGKIENILSAMSGTEIQIVGSGRTDAWMTVPSHGVFLDEVYYDWRGRLPRSEGHPHDGETAENYELNPFKKSFFSERNQRR